MFAFVAGKVYALEGICYLLTRRSARARALLIRERCEERACRGFVAFFLLTTFECELFVQVRANLVRTARHENKGRAMRSS